MYYIYEILDHKNNPIYVGQTLNITRRMNEHRWAALCSGHSEYKKYLYRKIRKLIRESAYVFTYRIICEAADLEEANKQEQYQISFRKSEGFRLCNLTSGGEGTPGKKPIFTDEWKQKLSEAAKKRVRENPEGMHRASLAAKGEESERKRKEAYQKTLKAFGSGFNKGKKLNLTQGQREAIQVRAHNSFFGKAKTEEHKRKIGIARSGKNNEKVRPLQVIINDEEFIWIEGTRLLSEHLLEKYSISLHPVTIINMYNKKGKNWREVKGYRIEINRDEPIINSESK